MPLTDGFATRTHLQEQVQAERQRVNLSIPDGALSTVLKYNPHHDKAGKFTSHSGSADGGTHTKAYLDYPVGAEKKPHTVQDIGMSPAHGSFASRSQMTQR